MVELSLVLFRVALFTNQTFQSFIISIFIYAWKFFIKNLKGIQVRLMTEICFVGKENSFTTEGKPCTLGRVKKMHNQVSTSMSQLLNLTADFKMVKSHTKAKVQNIPSYQAGRFLLQPCYSSHLILWHPEFS